MAFKTEAIILREKTLKGADRVYDILTPNEGKLSVIARSASRSSSKMAGHLTSFSRVFLMIGRGGRDHLAGVRTINSYRRLKEDWFDFILTSSLVELILKVNVPGQVAQAEYQLLNSALDLLIQHNRSNTDKAAIGRIFLWKMLTLSGWQPNLEQCAFCQVGLSDSKIFYQPTKGFVCLRHNEVGIPVSKQMLELLAKAIFSNDWADIILAGQNRKIGKMWQRISRHYYQDIINNPLQSLNMFQYVQVKEN
jgi:DNA repair protein RecO